jgi:precorrin-6B methylase 2
VEGARVLDLYAGTGAVGIEALSRGAEHATFVDDASQAVASVRENLRRTGFEDRGLVHRENVLVGFTVAVSRGSRSSKHVIPLHWDAARRLSYGDSVVTLFRSPGAPGRPGSPRIVDNTGS